MNDRRDDPRELSVREAVQRYLRRRRADASDASVETWRYRLKLFVEWTESLDVDTVGELRPLDLDEYYDVRSGRVAPATLEGEMWTLRKFVEYLEQQLDAVPDGLIDAVRIPDVDDADRVDETRLEEPAALTLLDFYRDDDYWHGTREHAVFELAWYTGARMGGLRALDLRDVHHGEAYVAFKHRPDTGTPLKNKRAGERPVALPETVIAVLGAYIRAHRKDVHDEHGRQPLLASSQGRPIENSIRNWSYQATEPCLHSPCPHGKERASCEWTRASHASQCPSSRSPHQLRTGSITWQLNIGLPPAVVAERVNASLDVIEQHYDQESPRERMERRRRPYVQEHMETTDDTTEST